MNKFFNKLAIGISLGLTLIACNSKAGTATVTVLGGTMTNLFSFTPNQGSVLVKQVIVSPATGVVPQLLSLVDTPTNVLVFTTLAYTNKISYATNYVVVYTNFYGVVTSNNWYQAAVGNAYTNYELVDITNSVPQATNNYNVRFSVGVVSNSPPIVYSAINQYYDNGIWVTNAAASGSATVTIVW